MSNLREGPLVPVFLAHGDKCKRCTASIIWAVTTNGRRMPLDALPHVDGNVELTFHDDGTRPTARVLRDFDRMGADPGSLYVAHFATCPKAAERNVRPRR